MSQGRVIRTTKEQITAAGAQSGKRIPSGTVLLSFKLSIGKVGVAGIPLYTNEAIAALPIRDTSELDADYLVRALETSDLAWGANRAAMGSTLNKAQLKAIRLPVPPLAKQRRIAAVLDKADALRANRRQVLSHLNTLTQSVFYDIFGAIGSSHWNRVPLGDLVEKIESGTSPNCEPRPARADEWGVLKLGAVTYGVFQPDENKAYLGDARSMSPNEVRAGDVLMTRKNTRELVGAVALVDTVRPRLLMPDLVFRLHLDLSRVDRRYFQALMMHPAKRPAVRALSSGSAASMPNISKGRLTGLPLELPPLELQREFASRVQRLTTQQATVHRALAADDALFASLQDRAFRGAL